MKKNYKNIIPLLILLIIIMIISLLNMLNAPLLDLSYKYNFLKQLIWYIIGFIILFILTKINIEKLYNISFLLYLFSLFLLILVLFIGKDINGAKAWFSFKFFSFQPSELMKLSLALYLTNIVSKSNINKFKDELLLILKVIIITLIPSIFVFLEPDTGAIIFFFIIALSILFTSLKHKSWFIVLFFLIILCFLTFIILYLNNKELLINLIGTSFFYRVERLITFTNQSSYQLENALTVIGSSSFLGTGLKKVSLYIPEAPTDFIFAFTIGNFGLLTGLLILLCYLLIDLSFINLYFKLTNKKIKLFMLSFISIFFFQQIINISMNLGLLPIIGIPLPFLSYGGSTIIIYFIFLGIIFNYLFKDNNLIKY